MTSRSKSKTKILYSDWSEISSIKTSSWRLIPRVFVNKTVLKAWLGSLLQSRTRDRTHQTKVPSCACHSKVNLGIRGCFFLNTLICGMDTYRQRQNMATTQTFPNSIEGRKFIRQDTLFIFCQERKECFGADDGKAFKGEPITQWQWKLHSYLFSYKLYIFPIHFIIASNLKSPYHRLCPLHKTFACLVSAGRYTPADCSHPTSTTLRASASCDPAFFRYQSQHLIALSSAPPSRNDQASS